MDGWREGFLHGIQRGEGHKMEREVNRLVVGDEEDDQ